MEFGLSVDGYIQRLVRLNKTKLILQVKNEPLISHLLNEIYQTFPLIDDAFLSAVNWLRELFDINRIGLITFLAWNECI